MNKEDVICVLLLTLFILIIVSIIGGVSVYSVYLDHLRDMALIQSGICSAELFPRH